MASRLCTITVDAHNPTVLAEFWRHVFGYRVAFATPYEVAIERAGDATAPAVLFLAVPDEKVVKNRMHFDLVPDDQATEVARLQALGARRIDIGQGEVPWVVMADPEGNEFCILTPDDS